MKKIIPIFLILFVCSFNTNAQLIDTLPWCPSGATWVYGDFSNGDLNAFKYEYEKDTVFDGFNVKKINCSRIQNGEFVQNSGYVFIKTFYLKESNDSIFFYVSNHTPNWVLLFDFGANENDTMYSYQNFFDNSNEGCEFYDTTIIEYDTILIQLQQKIIYKRKSIASYLTNIGTIAGKFEYPNALPKIGGINGNFYYRPIVIGDPSVPCQEVAPIGFFPTPLSGNLLCYNDNIRGVINYNQSQFIYNCEDVISDINKQSKSEKTYIYPNPADDYIIVDSEDFNINIKIYDLLGKLVVEKNIANNEKIDISPLKKGTYIVSVEGTKTKQFFKLLKN